MAVMLSSIRRLRLRIGRSRGGKEEEQYRGEEEWGKREKERERIEI